MKCQGAACLVSTDFKSIIADGVAGPECWGGVVVLLDHEISAEDCLQLLEQLLDLHHRLRARSLELGDGLAGDQNLHERLAVPEARLRHRHARMQTGQHCNVARLRLSAALPSRASGPRPRFGRLC